MHSFFDATCHFCIFSSPTLQVMCNFPLPPQSTMELSATSLSPMRYCKFNLFHVYLQLIVTDFKRHEDFIAQLSSRLCSLLFKRESCLSLLLHSCFLKKSTICYHSIFIYLHKTGTCCSVFDHRKIQQICR